MRLSNYRFNVTFCLPYSVHIVSVCSYSSVKCDNINVVIICMVEQNFTQYGYCLKIISWYYNITGILPTPISVPSLTSLTTGSCLHVSLQRRLWQLGTGQAGYNSQFAPKKEMYKIIRVYAGRSITIYSKWWLELINIAIYSS